MVILNSRYDIESLLKKALEDKIIINDVRRLLGDDGALGLSKVDNWKVRGFPPTFLEGAALIHCSGSEDENISRTGLSARSAWHVFYVEDNNTADKQDCRIWRFWEGMRVYGIAPRVFTHTTLIDEKAGYAEFESIGDSATRMTRFESSEERKGKKAIPLSCYCNVPTGLTYDIGYRVLARETLYCKADPKVEKPRLHEFLGGVNVVPVRRSYLLACIPERIISGLLAAWISFAPQVSPFEFIEEVVSQSELSSLINPESDLHPKFEPWGKYGSMEPFTGQIVIPEKLAKSLPDRWYLEENGGRRQRVLFAAFDNPPALTFQAMVYRLPEVTD